MMFMASSHKRGPLRGPLTANWDLGKSQHPGVTAGLPGRFRIKQKIQELQQNYGVQFALLAADVPQQGRSVHCQGGPSASVLSRGELLIWHFRSNPQRAAPRNSVLSSLQGFRFRRSSRVA